VGLIHMNGGPRMTDSSSASSEQFNLTEVPSEVPGDVAVEVPMDTRTKTVLKGSVSLTEWNALVDNMKPATVAIRDENPELTVCQSRVWTIPASIVLSPAILSASRGDAGLRYSEVPYVHPQGAERVNQYIVSHPELEPTVEACDDTASGYQSTKITVDIPSTK
jgi:hypothetical protein